MSAALAQRPRDDVGVQDLVTVIPARFALQSGDQLSDGRVLLRRYGHADAPQVLVLGGISAGRAVAGDGGWWNNIIGAGAAIDTERYGVLGIDFAPLSDQRVAITPCDQARLLAHAFDVLGIRQIHAFVGASYGGMVGLALAVLEPDRLRRLVVISAAHKPSALGLAWRGVQRRIVEFGQAHDDADGGLSLARQLAMTTYRSGEEFEARFGAGLDAQGVSEIDRYLIARGEVYPATMAPQRWLSLSEAIDRHSIDPAAIRTPTTLIACPTDQIVPFADVAELARRLPNPRGLHALPSIYGHDAFLKETGALRPILSRALEAAHDPV